MERAELTLKYYKAVFYIPDLARSRAVITDEERARAADDPPHPVPFHCKPWVDGQTAGWTLFYGFLTPITLTGLPDGRVHIENVEQLRKETRAEQQIDNFAPGLFSFSTGYKIVTPPGYVSLVLPPTNPPSGLKPLTAIVETDWYPKDIFLTIETPPEGESITLSYQDELARLVVTVRQDTVRAAAMSEEEAAEALAREATYLADERTTSTRWTAASGHQFTHLYKQRSREFRQQRNRPSHAGEE